MQCLKITKMRITKNIFNSSMHSTTIYMQSIEVMLNSNNVDTLYVVYFVINFGKFIATYH